MYLNRRTPSPSARTERRRAEQQQRANSLIRQGIGAVKQGQLSAAIPLLEEAASLDPYDSLPWLWLSATSDDPEQQRACLERALAADPNNGAAARGLMMLSGQYHPPVTQSADPQMRIFDCRQCGGRVAFNIRQQEVTCSHCGTIQPTAKLLAADAAEQSIHKVMASGRGDTWVKGHHTIVCERCGAHSLLPPQVTSDRCPYCTSNRVIEAAQPDQGLIAPQLVALLKVDQETAYKRLRTWLTKGGLTPGGLVAHVERLQLQVAYFPIWAFDGMLEISWRGEINEGSSKYPRWVASNGVECELFDDEIVSGLKSQPSRELDQLAPFNLKDLIAFEPGYLAGWPALTYDRPLTEASLQARQLVLGRVQRFLMGRVSGGRSMRNFYTGSPNWNAVMFKLMLMPIWVGSYTYRGKAYRVLVNGQTGKVAGSRPRNYFKLLAVALSAMLAALLLIVLIAIALSFLI